MKKCISALAGLLAFPLVTQAAIIDFDFTGRLIVADSGGNIIINEGKTYTPISASLSYDTDLGVGSSGLSITMNNAGFLNLPATFHDISMTRNAGTNLITGQIFVDWNGNFNMPLHIEWDATGLLNAIDFGLQAGDVLSGTELYHDANGNGVQDAGENTLLDIASATPYSQTLEDSYWAGQGSTNPDPQGPAPLAATAGSLGLDDSTPFPGVRGYFDIGSGNSLHVTGVSVVPVPAAIWLFGTGLLGLAGLARRRRT